MKNEKFDLSKIYSELIEKMGFKGDLPEVQKKVMKDIFFATSGRMLLLLRDELALLPDEQAVEQLQSMLDQAGNHFLQTQSKLN